ncbi:hypothetical protein K439DRAFT_395950 [Ramaria rubella]|nr:hypothetical protein K439DRAFT_395950 [Ramaria rubella]
MFRLFSISWLHYFGAFSSLVKVGFSSLYSASCLSRSVSRVLDADCFSGGCLVVLHPAPAPQHQSRPSPAPRRLSTTSPSSSPTSLSRTPDPAITCCCHRPKWLPPPLPHENGEQARAYCSLARRCCCAMQRMSGDRMRRSRARLA